MIVSISKITIFIFPLYSLLSYSTQHLSFHTWSTGSSSGPYNSRKTLTDYRGSKGGHKDDQKAGEVAQ